MPAARRRTIHLAASRAALTCVLLVAGACLQSPPVRSEAGAGGAAETPALAPALSPWRRLAVLGASASIGFGTGAEAGRPVSLDEVLDAAIQAPHQAPSLHATDLFFTGPTSWGEILAEQALAGDPTAVIAVDYLFWFVYGKKESEEQRLAELEVGLGWLGRFDCPLVIAEIPDMSASIGRMLSRAQVPAPETLLAANRRIQAWTAGRPGTAVLALAPREGEGLIQPDRLHPTVPGLAEIAVEALLALPGGAEAAASGAILADPALVAEFALD